MAITLEQKIQQAIDSMNTDELCEAASQMMEHPDYQENETFTPMVKNIISVNQRGFLLSDKQLNVLKKHLNFHAGLWY